MHNNNNRDNSHQIKTLTLSITCCVAARNARDLSAAELCWCAVTRF